MTELTQRRCLPCEGGVNALDRIAAEKMKTELNDRWILDEAGKTISAVFEFRNYYRTTAFINAVIWIAHTEDHHPDILFGYKSAKITYSTHALDGLSENDFICAAKVDALVA
jgi:4a-hydroxytetrahydrobiopterin dehydratase